MTATNFQTLLDGVDNKTSTVLDICKNYNTLNPSPVITDQQFNTHPFFTKYFSDQLCKLLDRWYSDGVLNDDEKEIFSACSTFLFKLTRTNSNIKQWLNQQNSLINITEKCLNEIGSYGYYIGIGGTEDTSLEAFDWLIQAFENVQCQQLLNALVTCVTSRFYVDAFYRLSDVDALSFTVTQHFLLVTCPDYILTCDTDKSHCLIIANKMINQYGEIFGEFLPHIIDWTIPVILCLTYPIKFILANIRALTCEQKTIIYNIILKILLNRTIIYPSIEQVRVSLVYTSLCLLIEIIRSDTKLANTLRNETDEKADLINILHDLSNCEHNDKIQLKAIELTSLLVPEEELLKDDNTKQVTELFVKNFNEAVEEGKPEEVDEILSGLKDLVQNDEVKQEIIKQNGLPSIMKYVKDTNDDPLPLEITYAMTFNNDAKKAIHSDTEFVDHIKQLKGSEKKDVSQIAHGIMWKLEEEEKFKQKEDDKEKEEKKKKDDKSTDEPGSGKSKYDMMISYCWAQQKLCHKINDRLEQDGYDVWLDRDEMHGSIIERMAEAIEQSRFVLICMSSNYKNSINCKAEAEYAFNRKSKIVPLVVEPKYRADGWLGFLAGSKIYVDFAEKEGEQFDEAYATLIAELERNGLRDVDEDEKSKVTPSPKVETKPEEPEKPHIETKEYLTAGPPSMWSDRNVAEFLSDNQLEQLLPICESMDGEALTEFHQSCQTMPDVIYGILNQQKDHPVSIASFYKFISRFKKFSPPKPRNKVSFQYKFVYPPSTKTKASKTDDSARF